MTDILDFMVEFYGNMIILCIYLEHEMYTLLLLDMPTGMPEPYIGSWQCMYQSNVYIDMSRPVIH